MKFFWKLYFSIMVITMSCFSIGSYMLIESGFHATLEREVENAYHENDIISSILNNLFFYDISFKYMVDVEYMINFLEDITIQNDTNILFCLRNTEGKIIYMDGSFSNKDHFIDELTIKKQF